MKSPFRACAVIFAGLYISYATAQVTDHESLPNHLIDRETRTLLGVLENWRNASGPAKAALEPVLQSAATMRRAYLVEALDHAPDAAFAALLDDTDRADVESVAPGTTAQPIVVDGELQVWIEEDFGTGPNEARFRAEVLETNTAARLQLCPAAPIEELVACVGRTRLADKRVPDVHAIDLRAAGRSGIQIDPAQKPFRRIYDVGNHAHAAKFSTGPNR